VGDDANPCSRTAPCKTFAGAISKTAPNGEIDALDPGGFGALTITKSITLDGGGGQVASILVTGTNGIVVSAQPTDVVIIRNLRFDGLLGNGSNSGNAGLNGIRFIGGRRLTLENVDIFGFNNNCVDIVPPANNQMNVVIRNSTLDNCNPFSNTNGLGAGVNIATTSGSGVTLSIERSMITNSRDGVFLNGTSGPGSNVNVYETNITGNAASGVTVQSTSSSANLFVKNSMLTNNATGGVSNGGSASLLISGTVVTGNTTAGFSSIAGGAIFSYHDDPVNANPGGAGSAPTQINPL
jgi:hypothetical protein